MNVSDRSPWRDSAEDKKTYPKLEESRTVDVAIIGGGITGITAAYLLRNSGKQMLLLEEGDIGQWSTGATTGFLMDDLDVSREELVKQYGAPEADRIQKAHTDAISLIERIVIEENIECNFMRCTAMVAGREVNQQAKFHPLKYLYALAEKSSSGVSICEHTEVTDMKEQGETVLLLLKDGLEVRAAQVLVATNAPFLPPDPWKLYFKKAWYTTYVLSADIPKGTLKEGLYEDDSVPYHYWRVDAGKEHDRLLFGGEDHRSDIKVDEEKSFKALEDSLRDILPHLSYTVTHRWKGQIVEPGDGLAYIGTLKNSPRIFYATGYSGTGLTYATIAAQMFTDHVLGRANTFPKEFDANRPFKLRHHIPKALEYILEFFNGAVKNTVKPE